MSEGRERRKREGWASTRSKLSNNESKHEAGTLVICP